MHPHTTHRARAAGLALLLLCLAPAHALAGWGYDGKSIDTYSGVARLAPHPSGGTYAAIFRITDLSTFATELRVQWYDAGGLPQFAGDGVLLSSNTLHPGGVFELEVEVAPDGTFWTLQEIHDGADTYLLAHNVKPDGSLPLGTAGVELARTTGNLGSFDLATDGSSYFYAAWDVQDGSNSTVLAQSLLPLGSPRWTAGGVEALKLTTGDLFSDASIAPDGIGGLLLVCVANASGDLGIRGQRLSNGGFRNHPLAGKTIDDDAVADERHPLIVRSADGNFWVAWADDQNTGGGVDFAIWTSNIDANLDELFRTDFDWQGTNTVDLQPHAMLPYGDGFTLLWESAGLAKIVRLSGSGSWAQQVLADSMTIVQNNPTTRMVDDGQGGVYVVFEKLDDRHTQLVHVDAGGRSDWPAPAVQGGRFFGGLSADGGACYLATNSDQGGTFATLAIQRYDIRHGGWGIPQPVTVSATDVPNDQGGYVALNWAPSEHDAFPVPDIAHYSLWRAVDALPRGAGATATLEDYRDRASAGGPVYRRSAAGWYWEWVEDVAALQRPGYSRTVPTRSNSTLGNPQPHQFQVIAHTADPWVYWEGDVVTGESQDNLAPAAPASLVAHRTGGGVELSWPPSESEDAAEYIVYRSTSPNVAPSGAFAIGTTADTGFVDASAAANQRYYYIVGAIDVHGNYGPESPEAIAAAATSAGELPVQLVLGAPVPNPFNPRTTIPYAVPAGGADFTVELFDAAGRRVRLLHSGWLPAGHGTLKWDGLDDSGAAVASGVYHLRLRAPGVDQHQRAVLLR